jgi:hypothetical protein
LSGHANDKSCGWPNPDAETCREKHFAHRQSKARKPYKRSQQSRTFLETHSILQHSDTNQGSKKTHWDARRLVKGYVEHYNNVRLNSAIGYITPKDMLDGHQQEIQTERDRKLDAAREQRQNRRQRVAMLLRNFLVLC